MVEKRHKSLQVRIPPDLHRHLVEAAGANTRSLNAEILHRLGATFAIESYVRAHEERMEAEIERTKQRLAALEEALVKPKRRGLLTRVEDLEAKSDD